MRIYPLSSFSMEKIWKTAVVMTLSVVPLMLVSKGHAEANLRGKIVIRSIQENDDLWGKRFEHPMIIGSMDFKRIMWGLHYSKKLSAIWEEPQRVFDKRTISLTSKHFLKKLSVVKPGEEIFFSLKTSKGTTSGELFVLDNAFNWRFREIHGMDYIMDTQSVAQESSGEILVNWRMAPQKNQDYFYSENILGFKTREEVWITVPVKDGKGLGSGDPKSVPDTNTVDRQGAEIKKKLKMHKEMKEENLISDQDYQIKVKELLRRF